MTVEEKLETIFDLIILFDKEYGKKLTIETLTSMHNDIGINTIDDLLESLTWNSPNNE